MVLRTEALYQNRIIGIEYIYTILNGDQINIPEKLEWLRQKGQNNELFCPCGCGANLIVVAGDKQKKEQHFRIKENGSDKECNYKAEGKESVDSKIVLKCWLDENIETKDIEPRVPIYAINNSNRKYEYTFLSRKSGIAVNYCFNRVNLSDEKMEIIDDNGKNITVIHVVDSSNGGTARQYPENMMKVQNRQGYCLLLTNEGRDYHKSKLKVVYYDQDVNGYWKELCIADGLLSDYKIINNKILFRDEDIASLLQNEKTSFEQSKLEIENKKKLVEKEQAEAVERQRKLKEQEEKEAAAEEEKFKKNLKATLIHSNEPVVDKNGNRYLFCSLCQQALPFPSFNKYGIPGYLNVGACKECEAKNKDKPNIYAFIRQELKKISKL